MHLTCGPHAYAYTRLTRAYCRAQANRHLRHMRNEERSQPLADGSILEYIVHGEYASKETDTNSRYGAWWMSLQTMVRQVGKEVVEKKLEDFEDEVKRLRT